MSELNLKSQLSLLLEHRDLTVAELARRTGVPKSSLSDWLSGSSPRNLKHLKAVADELGTTIDHLMFGRGRLSESRRELSIDELIGDKWVTGLFEIKLRRVKKIN